MSSKSFGLGYIYALQKLGGRGVGMATNFTIIPTVESYLQMWEKALSAKIER